MTMFPLRRSYDELRAVLRVAGKEVRKLNVGGSDTPVLKLRRCVLRQARAVAMGGGDTHDYLMPVWMMTARQICLALAVAGIAIGQTKPKDVDGWSNITWGMSVTDAKVALGDQASESETAPGSSSLIIERLVIKNLLIGDISCRGSIFSKKSSDAIVSVTIYAKQTRDPPFLRELTFDSLKILLIEKYGQPNNEDRKVEGRDVNSIVVWTFPSTSISLRRSETPEGIGSVLVNYSAVDKKALDVL